MAQSATTQEIIRNSLLAALPLSIPYTPLMLALYCALSYALNNIHCALNNTLIHALIIHCTVH